MYTKEVVENNESDRKVSRSTEQKSGDPLHGTLTYRSRKGRGGSRKGEQGKGSELHYSRLQGGNRQKMWVSRTIHRRHRPRVPNKPKIENVGFSDVLALDLHYCARTRRNPAVASSFLYLRPKYRRNRSSTDSTRTSKGSKKYISRWETLTCAPKSPRHFSPPRLTQKKSQQTAPSFLFDPSIFFDTDRNLDGDNTTSLRGRTKLQPPCLLSTPYHQPTVSISQELVKRNGIPKTKSVAFREHAAKQESPPACQFFRCVGR